MNGGVLQSTLRELKLVAASSKLWLTFGAVVLLFAVTGPFGTLEQLRFLPRLAYWLGLHLLAWSTALLFSVLGNVLLRGLARPMLWRMLTGSILAAVPIGVETQAVQYAWFGRAITLAGFTSDVLYAVPLTIIFCLISYMTMSPSAFPASKDGWTPSVAEPVTASAAVLPATMEAAPLLRRLHPENRGALLHLSVEDHYTVVKTSRGSELILLRFSDALAEIGATRGLRVHRSHWVAENFVSKVRRTDGRLTLELADGTEVPVSRSYAADVRTRLG